MMTKAVGERPELDSPRIPKRLLLVSDMQAPMREVEPEFLQAVTTELQNRDALLQIISLDLPGKRPI